MHETGRKSAETAKAVKPKTALYTGCMVAIIGLPLLWLFISAIVGIITGNLYSFGRRGETYHGTLARVISAVILIIFASIISVGLWGAKKNRAKNP